MNSLSDYDPLAKYRRRTSARAQSQALSSGQRQDILNAEIGATGARAAYGVGGALPSYEQTYQRLQDQGADMTSLAARDALNNASGGSLTRRDALASGGVEDLSSMPGGSIAPFSGGWGG